MHEGKQFKYVEGEQALDAEACASVRRVADKDGFLMHHPFCRFMGEGLNIAVRAHQEGLPCVNKHRRNIRDGYFFALDGWAGGCHDYGYSTANRRIKRIGRKMPLIILHDLSGDEVVVNTDTISF